MATLNSITQFTNPLDYQFFALCPIGWVSSVSTYSSGGYEEYEACDVYASDDYSLLCFKPTASGATVKHDFLASRGDESCIIQATNYESVTDVISGERLYPHSFYTYTDSVYSGDIAIDSFEDAEHHSNGKSLGHCYEEWWGPRTFYEVTTGYNIINFRTILSLTGTAHIVRMDTKDGIQNRSSRAINCTGHSLRGVIKSVYEWLQVSEEPFLNTEKPAVKASAFLNGIGISGQILSDALSESPDMRVIQYLTNTTIPIEDLEENHSVPASLSAHLRSVYRYRTLASLVMHHPNGNILEVEQDIIDEQKSAIENSLYSFMAFNSIDTDTLEKIDYRAIVESIPINMSNIEIEKLLELCEAYNGYQ